MAGVHAGRPARAAGAPEDFIASTVPTCSLRDVAAKLGDVAIVGMKPDPVERLADALLGDD